MAIGSSKKVATKKTSSVEKPTTVTNIVKDAENMSKHDALVYITSAIAGGVFARKEVNVTEMDKMIFSKAKVLLELIEKETNG